VSLPLRTMMAAMRRAAARVRVSLSPLGSNKRRNLLSASSAYAYRFGAVLRCSRCANSRWRLRRRGLDNRPCRRFHEASRLIPSSHGLQPN
jgi:hypothetical protein